MKDSVNDLIYEECAWRVPGIAFIGFIITILDYF